MPPLLLHHRGPRVPTDYSRLVAEWDSIFHETVDPTRDKRTGGILDVLGTRFEGRFQVLDLGSGPGSLAARILDRFPRSRVVALDTDPALVQIGRRGLRRFQGRLTWVLSDLRKMNWWSDLGRRSFDAVVSSLALNWLEEDELSRVYLGAQRLLRPGGILVNGDFIPSNIISPIHPRETNQHPAARRATVGDPRVEAFKPRWEAWWGELERTPAMRTALRLRKHRMPGPIPPGRSWGPKVPVTLAAHKRALRETGFGQPSLVWRKGGFCVFFVTA